MNPCNPIQPAGTKEYYLYSDCDWEVSPMQEDPGTLYAIPGRKSIAAQLEELQYKANGAYGIGCVRAIIHYLRLGDFGSALSVRRTEGDKTRAYPQIEKKLTEAFGCRMHAYHNCEDAFCKMKVLLNNVEVI